LDIYFASFFGEPVDLKLENIAMSARSVGGIGTTISFPEFDLSIDMGICFPKSLRTSTVAFTHTHADHIAGLPTYLGVRRLFGMNPPRFICAKEKKEALEALIAILGELQGRPFDHEIIEITEESDVPIAQSLYLRSVKVNHANGSVGYLILRKTRRLREDFSHLAKQEVIRLKETKGDEIFYTRVEPLAFVSGDATADSIPVENELVRNARIALLECTFLGGARSSEDAQKGNHSHLDDLLDLFPRLSAKKVVLYHFSQIYSNDEILRFIAEKVPFDQRDRIIPLLPQDEDRL